MLLVFSLSVRRVLIFIRLVLTIIRRVLIFEHHALADRFWQLGARVFLGVSLSA